MPTCVNCGRQNSDDARFCAACGAELLDAAPGRAQARKVVTVVFCDLVGSTGMGERLDPESVRRVMTRYFAEMRSALERHGGSVQKFIGDAVMAVFGIPTLHEDDALRAVRAAVDMRVALAALNDELEQRWRVRLQTRTGVNTGKVVAGDPLHGQALVVGDAVNVAARLEQVAGANEILIGEETQRLVRDAVRTEPSVLLVVKGKAAPLPAFKLLEVFARRQGFDRLLKSPLVGREQELTALLQAFEHVLEGRSCRLCTVVGPAGIGKSRLTRELVAALGDRARVLSARCLPYGEGITYWPIAEAVRQLAGLREDESMVDAREKILALLPREEDAAQIVERVGNALGISESASSPEETSWGVRRLVKALASERPLVLIFDDVHWGEATFLDLIEQLAERSQGVPVLLLCLARTELLERRPDFGNAIDDARTLALEPLAASQCHQLVVNLVGEGKFAQALARRVGDHASGNPLYLREMIRMLVDEGILKRENGSWHAVGDISTLRVPPTIESLLGARLEMLEAQERTLLERASVIGEEFWTDALLELCPGIGQAAADTGIRSLLEKELIGEQQPSGFAGESAYCFTHVLVRDVAYDRLLKESRAELHARFADWLGDKVGSRLPEYQEIVGYHLEQSYRYQGEIGTIDEAGRAIGATAAKHLASAGRRAFARGDISAAANLLTRASGLPAENDRFRLALQLDLVEVLMQAGELARADSLLSEMIRAAARQGARGLECHGRIVQLFLQLLTDPEGKIDEALEELQRGIPILEELKEERALAKAWLLRAELNAFSLRHGEVEMAAERALHYARRSGDELEQHEIQALLTIALVNGPTPAPLAIERLQALLEKAKDDPRGKAYANGALAVLHAMSGNFDDARRHGAIGRAICEELDWRFLLGAGVAQVDGEVELLADEPAAAESVLRAGYELLVEMGEKSSLSTVAAMLAEALYRQGREEEAERFTVASEEAAAAEDAAAQIQWRGARAKILAKRGLLEDAELLAREAAALAGRTDAPNVWADALVDLAGVLSLAGRTAEAARAADRALDLYREKGNQASSHRARSFRDQLIAVRR